MAYYGGSGGAGFPTNYGTIPAAAPGSGTGYTGYDAAVYAAATTYLQNKAAGGTPGSSSRFAPAARAGYSSGVPNKDNKGRRPFNVSAQTMHYCDVCKVSCAGPQTYKEHLDGVKHKKKEQMQKEGKETYSTQPRSKITYKCDLCQVACTGSDTYNAHIKGAKHQKTVHLHQKLGKPLPSNEPTIIAPKASAREIEAAMEKAKSMAAGSKVVAVPQMQFVGGNQLVSKGGTTATINMSNVKTHSGAAVDDKTGAAIQAAIQAEECLKPVGEDYMETRRDPQTKQIQYHCKLCDCSVLDQQAKMMHLKGRRHRLAYKKKVDPSIEVDMPTYQTFKSRRANDEKSRRDLMRMRQQELWSMRAMYSGQALAPLPGALGAGPVAPYGPVASIMGPRGESPDDAHVMAKHALIYPTEDELNTVQSLVINTEKALKTISDLLHEEEVKAIEASREKGEAATNEAGERLLKGVMRVGLLAKGLLLKGDEHVQLVVLCSRKPTNKILNRIVEMLPEQLKKIAEDTEYTILADPTQSAVLVKTTTAPLFTATISVTSTLHREPVAEADDSKLAAAERDDLLPKQPCLEALAELRHAKWFQARCSNLQPALVILRIMRDICQRIPTWTSLKIWALELLIEKVLSSAGQPLSPGDAMRRVFEAVSAGVLLPMGPGLLDPCERENVDVVSTLEPQRREDITSSAQHALRLVAFNQMYKILAVDRIKVTQAMLSRKRPAPGDSTSTPAMLRSKEGTVEPGEYRGVTPQVGQK